MLHSRRSTSLRLLTDTSDVCLRLVSAYLGACDAASLVAVHKRTDAHPQCSLFISLNSTGTPAELIASVVIYIQICGMISTSLGHKASNMLLRLVLLDL